MKLLFVGAEALPFASTGGLADVLGSLPAALKREKGDDLDIRVVLPLYQSIGEKYRGKMEKVTEFFVQLSWRNQYCGLYSYDLDGVTYYFIDNQYYFSRGSLYGNFDDGERFAFFSMAVMEMLPKIGFFPDVLHAHDWQSALTVIYLRTKYNWMKEYREIRTVYTIHNIDYQGIYDMNILGDVFGLSDYEHSIVEYNGMINLTKGAIVCCDKLTTVSQRYAEEIQMDYFASGLQHILRMYSGKVMGIVNGIDVDYYNPETDPVIFENYTAETVAEGKAANKAELQKQFSLPESPDTPVIAMVSRLASHKGFDLVKYAIEKLLTRDVQFVLLGTGESELEVFFENLQKRYPEKVSILLAYNKDISKQIYAGADIFLMPSKSEPCGLAQMIASRYGTVPIVREVGGLYDTIHAYNPETGEGNGITFCTYDALDMLDACLRAIDLYDDPEQWETLRDNAMNMDFSWAVSAKKYLEMYQNL
ncbi:MAG: glycogen synthase GlgA [Clostridia bacterium]|nr:glycogen synthase GlgA [Clostridia bacterium]